MLDCNTFQKVLKCESYKDVRLDTEIGDEWLIQGLTTAQTNMVLELQHFYALQRGRSKHSTSPVESSRCIHPAKLQFTVHFGSDNF